MNRRFPRNRGSQEIVKLGWVKVPHCWVSSRAGTGSSKCLSDFEGLRCSCLHLLRVLCKISVDVFWPTGEAVFACPACTLLQPLLLNHLHLFLEWQGARRKVTTDDFVDEVRSIRLDQTWCMFRCCKMTSAEKQGAFEVAHPHLTCVVCENWTLHLHVWSSLEWAQCMFWMSFLSRWLMLGWFDLHRFLIYPVTLCVHCTRRGIGKTGWHIPLKIHQTLKTQLMADGSRHPKYNVHLKLSVTRLMFFWIRLYMIISDALSISLPYMSLFMVFGCLLLVFVWKLQLTFVGQNHMNHKDQRLSG